MYSIYELKTMFLKSVSDAVGSKIKYASWFEGSDDAAVPAPTHEEHARAVNGSKMASLEDHFDPVWICSQSSFNIGSMIVEKGISGSMFTILSIAGKDVVFHEACSYRGEPTTVKLVIDELLKS